MENGNAGCQCGDVRLAIAGKPVAVLQCHCKDCQKSTGGGPAVIALYRRDNVKKIAGEAASHAVTGASGGAVRRFFCATCGSPVYSELDLHPNLVVVKLGAFDADPGFAPQAAIWTASAPAWHHIPDGIPSYPAARG